MKLPTADQVLAVSRHAATFVAGGALMAGMLGLRPEDVNQVAGAINNLGTGIAAIITALGIIVPIVSGMFAGKSASPAAQAAKVQANPNLTVVPQTEEGERILAAAAKK